MFLACKEAFGFVVCCDIHFSRSSLRVKTFSYQAHFKGKQKKKKNFVLLKGRQSGKGFLVITAGEKVGTSMCGLCGHVCLACTHSQCTVGMEVMSKEIHVEGVIEIWERVEEEQAQGILSNGREWPTEAPTSSVVVPFASIVYACVSVCIVKKREGGGAKQCQ